MNEPHKAKIEPEPAHSSEELLNSTSQVLLSRHRLALLVQGAICLFGISMTPSYYWYQPLSAGKRLSLHVSLFIVFAAVSRPYDVQSYRSGFEPFLCTA